MHLRGLYPFLDLTRACGMYHLKDGGAARALKAAAAFLKTEKKIPAVLPDFSLYINAGWVQSAIKNR
jgi:ABC-type taurine transport system substrate-binding protein